MTSRVVAPPNGDIGSEGVPSCATGPAGRVVWVFTELRDAWRNRTNRSKPAAPQGPPPALEDPTG